MFLPVKIYKQPIFGVGAKQKKQKCVFFKLKFCLKNDISLDNKHFKRY